MTLRSPSSLKYPILLSLVSCCFLLASYEIGYRVDVIDADFVSEVGSAAYESTITNHTEVLPVSVDIIGESQSLL